jgi:hypothetical protein
MIACDECLRTNPPTRLECLYCSAALPLNSVTINLQKPTLRPLETWEQGYNNILLAPSANLSDANLAEAGEFLKLPTADLVRILSSEHPLPLARAASLDKAALIQDRLSGLGLDTSIVADAKLGFEDSGAVKVRAAELDEVGIKAYQRPGSPGIRINWSDFELLVVGRLLIKRVEIKEKRVSRAENRIVDSSEFFSDETVIEIYIKGQSTPYRIAANSFDFSCLGKRKGLLAGENMSTLIELFRHYAPQARWDESYNSIRKALEPVWPSEKQNESTGWRRDRPGKLSLGSVTEITNEKQFVRYSRLRHYFQTEPQSRTDD